nr:glycosyl hydrolase family 18 protein [Maliibacterium massiliense]
MRSNKAKALAVVLSLVLMLAGCARGDGWQYDAEKLLFMDNIAQEAVKEPTVLTWLYRPRQYKRPAGAVNTLAPTWFYVGNVEGQARVQTIAQMGLQADLAAYVAQAHQDNMQVWGTVVSMTPELSEQVIHDAALRADFIQKMQDYVRNYALDGINLDFEKMNPAHKADFTGFVQELKQALPAETVVSVCVTVPLDGDTSGNWYQCYDHAALAQAADLLCVMAYDQHTASSGEGPVAAQDWVVARLQKLLSMVPSDKVLLGVPFYGREYRFSAGEDAPVWLDESQDNGTLSISYAQLQQLAGTGSYVDNAGQTVTATGVVTLGRDEVQGVGYVEFDSNLGLRHRIWFEDGVSMQRKTALFAQYRMAGVAVWQAAFGHAALWQGLEAGMATRTLDAAWVETLRTGLRALVLDLGKKDVAADSRGVTRFVNLLAGAQVVDVRGTDTGVTLKGTLGKDRPITWQVYTQQGQVLLVPASDEARLVTGAQGLLLGEGVDMDMLRGLCSMHQK